MNGPRPAPLAAPGITRAGVPAPLLTRKEVGALLALTPRGVRGLERRGILTPVKIGSAIRIRAAEVAQLIDAPLIPPSPPRSGVSP